MALLQYVLNSLSLQNEEKHREERHCVGLLQIKLIDFD